MIDPQALDDFIHIVEQHGLSLVLLLLFIFWLRPKIDKLFDHVFNLQKAIAPDQKESVEKVASLNLEIKGVLREASKDMKSDWVQLWQFHNGTRGIGKMRLPFMYISLTNEVCETDCTPMRPEFSQMPLSLFDSFVSQLIERDLIFHDQQTQPVAGNMNMGKIMMEKFEAKSSVMRAIRDEDGMIIGFISFVFAKHQEFTEKELVKVRAYAQRMTAVLASFED